MESKYDQFMTALINLEESYIEKIEEELKKYAFSDISEELKMFNLIFKIDYENHKKNIKDLENKYLL